ncbi:MAG: hypothetical protein OXH50_17500, partial [Gemmatimonadetes bacterium]|nr:hypothetical protein [Gemmatimonadota bacterium]
MATLDTHEIARTLTAAADQFKAGLAEVRTEIAELRSEQRTLIAEVRTEIAKSRTGVPRSRGWMVGTVIATAALTVVILRFL